VAVASTMPAPHHSVFLQAGCPSCHSTNSVKALKRALVRVLLCYCALEIVSVIIIIMNDKALNICLR